MSIKHFIMITGVATTFLVAEASAGACNPCGDPCGSNPCADFCCDPCDGWSIFGDYLYWTARNCDLDYAVDDNSTGAGSALSLVDGHVKHVKPGYNSGFRVGLAKECNDMYLAATYTWFHPGTKSSTYDNATANTVAGTHYVPNLAGSLGTRFAYSNGKYELDYDSFDVLAGYKTDGDCFKATFFGGFKAAFIEQEFDILYADNVVPDGATVVTNRVKMTNDLDAYGIDLGFGGEWFFSECFSFFGGASFDVFLGDYDRHFKYWNSGDGGATETLRADLHSDCWKLLGAYNVAVGLTYHIPAFDCFCSNLDASISVGYELHNWVNTQSFLMYESEGNERGFDRHHDGLGFDGLFARLNINF